MLAVAADLFARNGFHATSMDEIAAGCGITKPMLYSYFGSKDGLREAIVQRTGDDLVQALKLVRAEADPHRRLERMLVVLIEFLYRDTARWKIAFQAMKGDSELAQRITGFRRAVIDLAASAFADFRPAGMDADTARARVMPYAYALMGAAESGAEWWVATPGVSLDETLRMSMNVLDALIDVARRELGAA